MDIFQIPGLTGWPATLLTLFGIVVYGWYIKKSSNSKAEAVATDAYKRAIEAMKTHTDILQERIKDTEKENSKLRQLFETMNAALKARGLYVAIDGNMIHVRDTTGGSTTLQISSTKVSEE